MFVAIVRRIGPQLVVQVRGELSQHTKQGLIKGKSHTKRQRRRRTVRPVPAEVCGQPTRLRSTTGRGARPPWAAAAAPFLTSRAARPLLRRLLRLRRLRSGRRSAAALLRLHPLPARAPARGRASAPPPAPRAPPPAPPAAAAAPAVISRACHTRERMHIMHMHAYGIQHGCTHLQQPQPLLARRRRRRRRRRLGLR